MSRYAAGKQCGLSALHAEDCLAATSTCIAGTSFTCVQRGESIVLQTGRHAMLDCTGQADESMLSDPTSTAGCDASTAVQDYRITCQCASVSPFQPQRADNLVFCPGGVAWRAFKLAVLTHSSFPLCSQCCRCHARAVRCLARA